MLVHDQSLLIKSLKNEEEKAKSVGVNTSFINHQKCQLTYELIWFHKLTQLKEPFLSLSSTIWTNMNQFSMLRPICNFGSNTLPMWRKTTLNGRPGSRWCLSVANPSSLRLRRSRVYHVCKEQEDKNNRNKVWSSWCLDLVQPPFSPLWRAELRFRRAR